MVGTGTLIIAVSFTVVLLLTLAILIRTFRGAE